MVPNDTSALIGKYRLQNILYKTIGSNSSTNQTNSYQSNFYNSTGYSSFNVRSGLGVIIGSGLTKVLSK
jgi:hypothetical protein